MRVDEALEPRRDRRQAAAGVDEDRDAALGREREDGREPLVVEQELLGARMELDPAGAEVEAAARLLDRPLVEREPHERDEAALRARGELERPVVAGAEAGMPVGLVEAEHEGARDAVAVHARRRAPRSGRPSRRCPCRGVCGRRRCRGRPGGRRAAARPTPPRPARPARARPRSLRIYSESDVPISCRLRKGHCRPRAAGGSKGAVISSPGSEAP